MLSLHTAVAAWFVRAALTAALALGVLAAALAAEAQQGGRVWRVGFLSGGARTADGTPPPALRHALQELGYVDGRNVTYMGRWADTRQDRLPGLAAELVDLKVDVIVTVGGPASEAAKQKTASIPIVLAQVGDAVAIGLIESLARPGSNVTGVTDLRRSERETVGVAQGGGAQSDTHRGSLERRRPRHDIAISRGRTGGAMYEFGFLVSDGGLMSYGANPDDNYRRAAAYIDRIFKGARPETLPVERPSRYYLTINLRTAKALGLTIPPSLLLRADQIIE